MVEEARLEISDGCGKVLFFEKFCNIRTDGNVLALKSIEYV